MNFKLKYEIIPRPKNFQKIIVEIEPQKLTDFVEKFEAEHPQTSLSIRRIV